MLLQQIIVALIVVGAVYYIGRMLYGALFGGGGCHSCSSNCESEEKSADQKKQLPAHLIQMQTTSHGAANNGKDESSSPKSH